MAPILIGPSLLLSLSHQTNSPNLWKSSRPIGQLRCHSQSGIFTTVVSTLGKAARLIANFHTKAVFDHHAGHLHEIGSYEIALITQIQLSITSRPRETVSSMMASVGFVPFQLRSELRFIIESN